MEGMAMAELRKHLSGYRCQLIALSEVRQGRSEVRTLHPLGNENQLGGVQREGREIVLLI